jgi:uncharacterized cupin superfamily protein
MADMRSMQLKHPGTAVMFVAALLTSLAWAGEVAKPVKVTATAAAGPIFDSPAAIKNDRQGPTTNVELGKSSDRKFTAGLFKAGPSDWPIDAYPEDEFCYFLTGRVKLTSADGTVLELAAGEAVLIPKGWKGRWTTPGYSKYYVVYDRK